MTLPPQSPPRILVVDDDPQVRDLVRDTLEGHGYQVVATAQAEEALARLRSERFDLLIAGGYTPPRQDDLTLRVRHDPTLRNTPVLMITLPGSRPDFIWPGEGEPADMFLSRPLNPKELLAFVKRFCSAFASTNTSEEKARTAW